MKRDLRGRLTLDASTLIELVFLTPHGLKLKEALKKERVSAHTTELAIAELRYVLCRKRSLKESEERVDKLIASGYIQVEDTSPLVDDAARMKCEKTISLADCFCLTLAYKNRCAALFARRETDLTREMQRKPFDMEILFLEDFV